MNKENDRKYIEDDEIDLRELFKTLWDKKIFIVLFTFFVTMGSIVYVSSKNPIPIYQGNVMIEIGEIKNENGNISYFDNPNTLKNMTEKFNNVSVDVIKGTYNLLNITAKDSDKEKITNELLHSINFIIERHKNKIVMYDKYIMTKQVGEIVIDNNSINKPKKKLTVIVSFVTGFILSVFLVFFMQFFNSLKKEDN